MALSSAGSSPHGRSLGARIRRPSIATRLTLVALGGLLLVQLVLLIGYRREAEEERAAELANSVALGQTVAAVVDSFAHDLERSAFTASLALARPEITLDQPSIGAYLDALMRQYPRLRAIFVTDPSGRVIASDSGTGVGTDLSTRPYLPTLRSGVEKVWSGSITGTESGEVTIAFGRPIRLEGGATRGYFLVAFHAARLVEGLPLNPPPDADITFIDERGQLLHSTLSPDLAGGERTVAAAPGVSGALQGRVSTVMGAHTPLVGDARYGAFVPVARTGWVVGFTRPQAALDERLRARFLQDAGGVGLVFLLAAVLLVLLARRVSAPLRRLSVAARAIAVGETPTIPAGSRAEEDDDEVGRLAAAMRAMARAVVEREDRLRAVAAENAALYEEAQAAVRLREEFLSIAAHELKTPITSVRGSAQLTLRRFEREGSLDAQRTTAALRTIDSQAARLASLVDRLLDVSRLRAGKLALELATCDLAALLRGAAERAQATTTRHVVVVHAPDRLDVQIDQLRIEQVVTNLLDNAIKYSPEGGAVEVHLDVVGESVRLAVRDHGTGIPVEDLSRVFDRFFQSHNASHLSGMGLGLYVAQEIVELHGGTISARLPEGGGTLVEVVLPVTASSGVDSTVAVPLSSELTSGYSA